MPPVILSQFSMIAFFAGFCKSEGKEFSDRCKKTAAGFDKNPLQIRKNAVYYWGLFFRKRVDYIWNIEEDGNLLPDTIPRFCCWALYWFWQ
jgi:hypothetical protein